MNRRLRNGLVAIVILAGTPAAFGQTSLTELGAANAARNDMMANSAGVPNTAPAAPTPLRATSGPTGSYGMKYTLSYALIGMLFGLGMYLVCRPSNRHEAD